MSICNNPRPHGGVEAVPVFIPKPNPIDGKQKAPLGELIDRERSLFEEYNKNDFTYC